MGTMLGLFFPWIKEKPQETVTATATYPSSKFINNVCYRKYGRFTLLQTHWHWKMHVMHCNLHHGLPSSRDSGTDTVERRLVQDVGVDLGVDLVLPLLNFMKQVGTWMNPYLLLQKKSLRS